MAAFEDRTSPDLEQFKGGRWTDWLGAIQSSEPKQQAIPEHTSKRNIEVARLRRPDMGLFGYRPATDKFYLVVCEHCGHLVKPQSLNIHYERKHTRKRITRLTPSSLTRASHSQSKNTIDKPNHKILPPPRVLKHGASSSHQKTSHVVLTSERSSNIEKSELIPEKAAAPSERERRHANSNNSRNHRTEKAGTKLIAPQPVKSLNSALQDNPGTQVRPHHSSKKLIHKPGGTIQLTEIPESHVKATSRHSVESSAKHQYRHHRTGSNSCQPQEGDIMHSMEHKKTEYKTLSDTHVPGSKSRKNHDAYHHHHHQMSVHESFSGINPLSPENVKIFSSRSPLVVLEKTHVAGSVKVGRAHKRVRPLSGSSESSVSPPRHKVPALHILVDAKGTPTPTPSKASEIVPKLAVPAKVKKKEKKMLPLKARQYDPNKHCGVWVKDENAHCRRSLTCKVHPLSAKRAVTGRRKQFHELIQEHGREKQRLKEKAAASPVVPAPSPVAQAIRSPSAPSPIQFAVPSPAPKATPLSTPPCTKVSTPTSQSLATTASKAKSSINLFPRIFGAWHVDCWDNEEVSEDAASPKLQNNCTCIQRHPQPLTVLAFQSRISGTCQVSYERRVERQLEALSTNFQKFGSKPTKSPKPFSFTPISGTTYLSAHSSITNENSTARVPHITVTSKNNSFLNRSQRALSNLAAPQNVPGVAQTDNQNNAIPIRKPSQKASRNNLSRKLSNLAPPDGSGNQVRQSKVDATVRKRSRSDQVSNLLKRTTSNASNVGYVTHANEHHSTSPLFILNDSSQETDFFPLQAPLVSNVANVNSPVVTLRAAMQSGEDRKCSSTPSAKLKSKSAIAKYSTITQAQTEARHAEHVDGSPILVQLPNGLNSLSRSVLRKPGLQSVTLSGNIGALTATGDDSNFSGSKVSKKLKKLNSGNSFIVQGEEISPSPLGIKSKQFIQPQLGQAAITRTNQPQGGDMFENFLQNDEHYLLDQQSSENVSVLNTENLDQQYAIQNSSYPDPVTLEQQSRGHDNSSTTTNILRVLCTQTDNCDTLQVIHNPQLTNANQIDASILEHVFGNQSTHITHSRLSVDTTQGCSTSNPTRTPDLGQNFITR